MLGYNRTAAAAQLTGPIAHAKQLLNMRAARVAGRKAFKLTRAGLLVSQAAWQCDEAWDKVHAVAYL